jgi:hypothetical protein
MRPAFHVVARGEATPAGRLPGAEFWLTRIAQGAERAPLSFEEGRRPGHIGDVAQGKPKVCPSSSSGHMSRMTSPPPRRHEAPAPAVRRSGAARRRSFSLRRGAGPATSEMWLKANRRFAPPRHPGTCPGSRWSQKRRRAATQLLFEEGRRPAPWEPQLAAWRWRSSSLPGTGSKPPGLKGWQRRMRQTVSAVPLKGPCSWMASRP